VASDGPSLDPRSSVPATIVAAASADDLDGALQAILSGAVAATGATVGAVFLVDPDRPGPQLAVAQGMDAAATEALIADVAEPSHPFAEAAVERLASFDRAGVAADGSAISGSYLPLVASIGGVEVSLGALGIARPSAEALTDPQREVLEALAALAAIITDRARHSSSSAERSEWFERLAHTDPLTGIANERTVARVLELELARAGRQGGEVSLALFDVDDFRSANADDGHSVGDDILRRVAAVLVESVRLVDTVGRIGGDEFVLVAPGAAGGMVARRVQEGIAALPAVAGRVVSVSAGVARFPVDGGDAESRIAAATEALQRAKDAGAGSVAGVDAPA
jgi:diguanylate cyclase (GGDEF)-like protein